MTLAMREAVISMLYKGKGKDRSRCKSYRPIAVTAAEYRILLKAVQLKLEPAIRKVIGDTNVAYLSDGRQIHANTLILAELARELEQPGRGGVAVMVDNTAAFDRVRWDFMHDILKAMKFPPQFRDMMKMVYNKLQYRQKIGGHVGGTQEALNGVRQGCPASPLAFMLIQEALLISIRGETRGWRESGWGQITQARR